MQRKLAVLACFFICTQCRGQQYPFVYYTPKDGLVNSRVRGIKQDSKGRMIFITYGGLSIYDGADFTNYGRQDGLAEELVNDVVEVGPDSFLVASNAQKLNTLVNGRIGVYKTADNFYPVINRFLSSTRGNWHVAADEGFFALENRKFIRIPLLDNRGVDVGFFLDKILQWKNFFLFIPWSGALRNRLILYDTISKKVTDIDAMASVTFLAADGNDQPWVTTAYGPKVLDTVALKRGKIRLLSLKKNYRMAVGTREAAFFFDASNNAWFYGNGIMRVSAAQQVQRIAAEQGLKAGPITDLYVDKEGTVWIATDGYGIIKIRGINTELLSALDRRAISISTISIHNDTLWLFNLADNKIYRVSGNRVKLFSLNNPKASVFNISIAGKKLYLNTTRELLYVENKDNEYFYSHPKTIIGHRMMLGLGTGIIDKNGMLIQCVKKDDSLFYLYVFKDEKLIVKRSMSNFTDQMALDRQGKLWMTARDGHVLVFTLHPERPSAFLQLEHDYFNELPKLSPRAITIDKDNHVWIGTRYNGVFNFAFKDGHLASTSQYTSKNGLTDNFVYTLTCDSSNTVWAGTQTGLDKIFRKNNELIIGNLSKNNNLFQTITKVVSTTDNSVWALSSEGAILRISGKESPAQPSWIPRLLLKSLRINGEVATGRLHKLSYNQNNLSFGIAAPSFVDEKSIRYSYLLEGSGNNKWSEPSNNSTFNFINLSPGSYTLKMRSDFPEQMYPPQFLICSFTVLSPWWETWWFRIGIGLVAFAVMIIGIRFYYRRKLEKEKIILEKQKAIDKERARIATDMHDDLGAGLSRIKFLSETIGIKKQQHQPIEEDIGKIREYSHEMIDKMGEIVWALNEKNDSLSDLVSYTRSYTAGYLSQNGIQCTVDTPDTLPAGFVSGEFRRNIFLTVKEALHNIVKHSRADTVFVNIEVGKNLTIIIEDNGIGFDESNIRQFSNGIHNMRKRMRDIGGALDIRSEKGTSVKLTVPLSI